MILKVDITPPFIHTDGSLYFQINVNDNFERLKIVGISPDGKYLVERDDREVKQEDNDKDDKRSI